MRRLTFLGAVIALIYGGYWYVAATAIERGVVNRLADLQSEGWKVEYAGLDRAGFPARFEVTSTDMSLVSADAATAWDVPDLHLSAPAYLPNQVRVDFPKTQNLRLGRQVFQIDATDLQGYAKVKPALALPLGEIGAVSGQVAITSDAGWALAAKSAFAAMTLTDQKTNQYALAVFIDDLQLPQTLIESIDPDAVLAPEMDQIALDALLTFDKPIDRHSLTATDIDPPQIDAITLTNAALVWGTMRVSMDGAVQIDAQGIPTGQIVFKTAQWRQLIYLLETSGTISPRIARAITGMARTMLKGDVLELPLSFQNGFMSVGPLPLGPAPRLR